MAKNKQSTKNNLKIKIIIFVVICLLVGLSFIFTSQIEEFINFKYAGEEASTDIDNNGLVMHFIYVEQAEAILVEFPNDKLMLVDTGENDDQSTGLLLNYLNNKVFANRSDKDIDYMLITHTDSDHVGGAKEVLEEFQVNKVFHPKISKEPTKTYQEFLTAMGNEPNSTNEFHSADSDFSEGGVAIEFLAPLYNSITNKKNNNQSPIMILTYAGKKIMLTGDAESDLEKDVLDQYPDFDFDIDVLSVGHHGSSTSSCADFLEATKPEYAVISCGIDNKHGHPTQTVLDRLEQYGVKDNNLFRTDLNGNVVLSVSANGVLAIGTDNSTYTQVYIKWIYIAPGIVVISFAVLFAPNLLKKNQNTKKSKKSK